MLFSCLLFVAGSLACCHAENWRIWTRTGDRLGSETNDRVNMTIIGSKGTSETIPLLSRNPDFRRNTLDHFKVTTKDVGTPKIVRLGIMGSDSWLVHWISLEDEADEEKRDRYFGCSFWLNDNGVNNCTEDKWSGINVINI